MEIKSTDLVSLFEQSLRALEKEKGSKELQDIGRVVQVGDENCRIHGLSSAVYGELLQFEGGNQGIVLDLKEDHLVAFLLDVDQ